MIWLVLLAIVGMIATFLIGMLAGERAVLKDLEREAPDLMDWPAFWAGLSTVARKKGG